jgi:two-component system chemotaxis response regulator CheY
MAKTNAKILIVDDSLTTRKVIWRYLFDGGYKLIDDACDGEQAWMKINAANPPYDLVIADWHMPILSGLGLLQKIRASPRFKSLAVIMATAERNKEEIVKIVQLGVKDYLVKPYDSAALLSAVNKVLP